MSFQGMGMGSHCWQLSLQTTTRAKPARGNGLGRCAPAASLLWWCMVHVTAPVPHGGCVSRTIAAEAKFHTGYPRSCKMQSVA